MDTSGLITIRGAVMSFYNRSPLDTRHLESMMAIAVECIGDLNIFHTHQYRACLLDISDTNLVMLPSDYIDFTTPPGIVHNHTIYPLTEDRHIPMNIEIDCGEIEGEENHHGGHGGKHHGAISYNSSSHHIDRSCYFNHYGVATHNIGYYRIDKEHRLIRLRGGLHEGKLYLEYSSTGISLDGETFIERKYLTVIRDYLMWQSIENNPLIPMNEKERKKDQYQKSLELVVYSNFDTSIDGIFSAIRNSYRRATPRR